jgi:hypothetical protein
MKSLKNVRQATHRIFRYILATVTVSAIFFTSANAQAAEELIHNEGLTHNYSEEQYLIPTDFSIKFKSKRHGNRHHPYFLLRKNYRNPYWQQYKKGNRHYRISPYGHYGSSVRFKRHHSRHRY